MEIREIKSFLTYYENIRKRTLRIIEYIPQEKIEWTHQEGKFTFGDIIRHLGASERLMFGENVQGKPSRYNGCGKEIAEGYEDVLRYFNKMHKEAMEIFANLSEADLESKCNTPAGTPLRTWKWLRAMVEHEIHHRGQIYLMLGILGVETPPLYGLTSEEVREKSINE